MNESDLPLEGLPVINALDQEILRHREVHFGGQFSFMIDYYQKEGKGCHPEFDLPRIEELAELEISMGENLAATYLTGADAEEVSRARKSYQQLKDLYEEVNPRSPIPLLIANLILSEEEVPSAEMAAIIEQKEAIVPALLEVMKSEDLQNPLYPGYSLAPALAAECLGKIGDERAIIALFEMMHDEDFFDDDTAIQALHSIGTKARDFLIKVLEIRPLTQDNERALVALLHFSDDPVVAKECFNLLTNPDFQKLSPFASYLALGCTGLKEESERKKYRNLLNSETITPSVKEEIQAVLYEWDRPTA